MLECGGLTLATVVLVLAMAGQARADSVTLERGHDHRAAGHGRGRGPDLVGQRGRRPIPTRLLRQVPPASAGSPARPAPPPIQAPTTAGPAPPSGARASKVDGVFDRREAVQLWSHARHLPVLLLVRARHRRDRAADHADGHRPPARPARSPRRSAPFSAEDRANPRPSIGDTVLDGVAEGASTPRSAPAGTACAPVLRRPTAVLRPHRTAPTSRARSTLTATTTQSTAGSYVVCLWLAAARRRHRRRSPARSPSPSASSSPPPAITSAAAVLNCTTGRRDHAASARAGSPSVCVQLPVLDGAARPVRPLTVSFVRPNRPDAHRRARTTWGESLDPAGHASARLNAAGLAQRGAVLWTRGPPGRRAGHCTRARFRVVR